MEDVYTIKVKTKPDTRNLYPSERRYSASTVSGLAWVHIALAATSFLLACLAVVSSNAETHGLTLNTTDTDEGHVASNETTYVTGNDTSDNATSKTDEANKDSNYILIIAPALVTIFGLAAGVASIVASVRWYIDHNITWLFIVSIFSTIFALISFVMVIVWFVTATEGDISDFYKDKVPFKEYFVVKHTDVIDRNESHLIIGRNSTTDDENNSRLFTKRVLSVNILIAAFLELIWSILSIKIAYKGMKSHYKDEDERRGNCISVVTTIKGNNTRKLPRNGKLLPPKPDLIEHYPNKKIKRIFLAQSDNSFYLKNQNNKGKQNTETSSEFYKERMMNFLNRCASLEGVSNTELRTPSEQSENALNPIPEVESVEINVQEAVPEKDKGRMTPVSWGDTPEHTVYNQNNINFDKIFNFHVKNQNEMKEKENANEEMSENQHK